MAKLHSKTHGKSGSKHPSRTDPPTWQTLSANEIENLIIKLYREGKQPSEIGMILRDLYGVPSVKASNKKGISKILSEHNLLKIPQDLFRLFTKAIRMHDHLSKNKGDISNKVKYIYLLSKIHRLAKYYKRNKILPKEWKFDIESVRLLVK